MLPKYFELINSIMYLVALRQVRAGLLAHDRIFHDNISPVFEKNVKRNLISLFLQLGSNEELPS